MDECEGEIRVFDANSKLVGTFQNHLIAGEYNLNKLVKALAGDKIKISDIQKLCLDSKPGEDLQHQKFELKDRVSNIFQIHMKGPPLLTTKLLREERVRIHEFERDLDAILTKIALKDFSVSPEFAKIYPELFEALPHCQIGTKPIGYTINAEFESFLSKGIELWRKFEAIFIVPRAAMFWHMNFYLPLLSLCCLAPVPSGLLSFKPSSDILLGPTARHIFGTSSGAFPDACDGWMFVQSWTQETPSDKKKPAKILFNGISYDADVLPVAEYDYMCGDPNILMIDLLAEFKGSDGIDYEEDRDKLIGEMAVASQCFVQVLKYNPYVFGITTSGPQIRFYALRSNEKSKDCGKQSAYKDWKEIGRSGDLARSIFKPKPFVGGRDQNTLDATDKEEEPSVEKPLDYFYECFYLSNLHITNFASYMQVLMTLWRMRVVRSAHLRDYYSLMPDPEDKGQAIATTDQDPNMSVGNNTNVHNTSNNNSGTTDLDGSDVSGVTDCKRTFVE